MMATIIFTIVHFIYHKIIQYPKSLQWGLQEILMVKMCEMSVCECKKIVCIFHFDPPRVSK